MVLKVIGAGVGRTGTYSLKLALDELGFGPCHHMEEVLHNMDRQVPLWLDALAGKPDWPAIYDGYNAAVDWPTAGFWRDLAAYYPDAKVILTTRDPERWYRSISGTILKLMTMAPEAPPAMQPWFKMALGLANERFFGGKTDEQHGIEAFEAHVAAVKAAVPAERLLVFEVAQGWEPLCAFLGKPVPDMAFPNTNDQEEFWKLVENGMG